MQSSLSIAMRALLAVVLMVGFYLLALGFAAALVYLPYAEFVYAHRLHVKLAAVCVLGALAILWSVLPRFDQFLAPGPELTRERHPQLFTELEGIARSVSQPMPAEVYLVPDVNAWVSRRGGIMGIGSRPVMGLGLPLLRLLTRSQFRAVLAHEFGHYHGGDTRLGPWIYKTHSAIGRTLNSLRGESGQGSLLQFPFLCYGKMFLRVTHAVSRRQEFVADELAARAVGARPLIEGLQTVHGAGPLYQAYWLNECVPVLNAGFRPPLSEGFAAFVNAGSVADAIRQHLDEELNSAKSNPYDTHPPLRERIAAVAHLPAGEVPANDASALSLLDDVPALENELLASIGGAEQSAKLAAIAWSEVCSLVFLPKWREWVKANAAALSGITPETLPQWAADAMTLSQRLVNPDGSALAPERAEGIVGFIFGAALTLLLVQKGGTPATSPGQNITVTLGSTRLEPFDVLRSLAAGKPTAEDWQRQCVELGIQGANLGTAGAQEQRKAG